MTKSQDGTVAEILCTQLRVWTASRARRHPLDFPNITVGSASIQTSSAPLAVSSATECTHYIGSRYVLPSVRPFHYLCPILQQWSNNIFARIALKDIGLKFQLNHASMSCASPIPCHSELLVLHTNGIHKVAIMFCGCTSAIPQHLQLLRRGLYSASQITVRTCSSFELLTQLHMFALTSKASTYDFYRALERLTTNTAISPPKYRLRALM